MARPNPCIGCGVVLGEDSELTLSYDNPFDCVDGDLTLKHDSTLEINELGQLTVVPQASLYGVTSGQVAITDGGPDSLYQGKIVPGIGPLMTYQHIITGLANPSATQTCYLEITMGFDGAVFPPTAGDGEGHLMLFGSIDDFSSGPGAIGSVSSYRAIGTGTQHALYGDQNTIVFSVPGGWTGNLAGIVTFLFSGTTANYVRATQMRAVVQYHVA